jgi:hypothetical protein
MKRIRNIWKLSAIDFIPDGTHQRIPEYTIAPTNNVVQIIKKTDATEDFINQVEQK